MVNKFCVQKGWLDLPIFPSVLWDVVKKGIKTQMDNF